MRCEQDLPTHSLQYNLYENSTTVTISTLETLQMRHRISEGQRQDNDNITNEKIYLGKLCVSK